MATQRYKAISFGVLNTSDADHSRLLVTAVLPPAVHSERRAKSPAFLPALKHNEERFGAMNEQIALRGVFACGQHRLGVPERIFAHLGPTAEVTLGRRSLPSSAAGRLLRRTGPLNRLAVPLIRERSKELELEQDVGVVELELKKAQLQLITITVPLRPETVFALDVRHVQESGAPIGHISLFFTPEFELR